MTKAIDWEDGEPAVLDRTALEALRVRMWNNPSRDTVSDGFTLFNLKRGLPAYWYCGTYHQTAFAIGADIANHTGLEAGVCYVQGFAGGRGDKAEAIAAMVDEFLGLIAPGNDAARETLKRELALSKSVVAKFRNLG